jgi:molybdopterin synthase catalytic subunit
MQKNGCRRFVRVTHEPLEQYSATQLVGDAGAGAIATFLGTTRDNFDGKRVLRLEYEAYAPMAHRQLDRLCARIEAKRGGRFGALTAVAILHRTGVVRVGEASVFIAVSSEHRAAALAAVHWLINELKARVPIWKKEMYDDGSSWKQNAEFKHARILLQDDDDDDGAAAATWRKTQQDDVDDVDDVDDEKEPPCLSCDEKKAAAKAAKAAKLAAANSGSSSGIRQLLWFGLGSAAGALLASAYLLTRRRQR